MAEVAPWLAPWDMQRLKRRELVAIEARYRSWLQQQQEG